MNTKYGNSLNKYDRNHNRNKLENKWSFLTVELFILIYVLDSCQGMSKENNSNFKTITEVTALKLLDQFSVFHYVWLIES